MPAFRSKTDRGDEAGFVFRSELPVNSRRAMAPFVLHAWRVKRSLDREVTSGSLLSYALVADVGAKRFTVASAWVDQESFAAWVGTATHRAAMADLGPRVTVGTFETEVRSAGAEHSAPAAAADQVRAGA